jgi:hypothetical protein
MIILILLKITLVCVWTLFVIVFLIKWGQLCSGPSFTQGWKSFGTKTYLFTACANCYLRFWGKVIFKTGNIQSTTWSWLNAFVRFSAIIQELTWSLIFYEKYSTSQSDLWFVNFHRQKIHWPRPQTIGPPLISNTDNAIVAIGFMSCNLSPSNHMQYS